MATKKPRMIITFEDAELYQLLVDISKLTGRRKSLILSDLLKGATEPLRNVKKLLEDASRASDAMKNGMVVKLDDAYSDISKAYDESVSRVDKLTKEIDFSGDEK